MGVWGLLWVTQDESAHADPGGTLDTEVRGALAEAVGRQVGKVTGGRHGERIRAKSLEITGQFFTPKTGAATGEYKKALDRMKTVDERVAQIERAVREVEDLSVRYCDESAQLVELERGLPVFEAELEAARREARALEEQEARAREAAAQHEAARSIHGARRTDVDTRAALTREAADAAADVERQRRHLEEMKRILEDQAREAAVARAALEGGAAELDRLRRELERANRRLARAHTQAEAARLEESLRKAQSITERIEAAERGRAAGGLDEHVYDEMQRIARQLEVLRTRLEYEGTRLVVRSPGGEEQVRVVAARAEIQLADLGALELTPARPGLAQAVGHLKEARAVLREALHGLGVEDPLRARERRAERAHAENEAAALRGFIEELAPKGVERLAERAGRARAESRTVEESLAVAVRAQAELEQALREIDDYPIDGNALETLYKKARQLSVARASHDAMGTELSVRALVDVRVGLGGEPAELLDAGRSVKRAIARPTTIAIGDVAEIRLVPRGEDLAKAAVKLQQAEHELISALRVHGVETLERAEAIAQRRGELDLRKARIEQTLEDAAPKGVDALRGEVKKRRSAAQELEEKLSSSREAVERLLSIESALAENLITKEAMKRVTALERELTKREAEVEERAARLRVISGPLVERLGTEQTIVSEPVRLDMPGGGEWEVIPGESGEGGELHQAEQALEETLKRAGVADLEAAKERWKSGLEQRDQRVRLEEQLELLAPGGLPALRARYKAAEQNLRDGCDAEGDATLSAIDLGSAIEALQSSLAAAEARRSRLEREASSRDGEREACERTVSELRGRWSAAQNALMGIHDKLASVRSVVPDAVLEERLEAAEAALLAARQADDREKQALAAATPELLRGDVRRAEDVLQLRRAEVQRLRDTVVQLKTLLDRAAAEGHFEELSDAKAEQTETADALERIEREARAAQTLSEVIEEAYQDAQRVFLGPVLHEAGRYLTKLRPGTEIRMTPDLKLDKVVRRQIEEDFDQLSGGTREQLSVIVRIALALVFAKDRRPLPLILDDTMGWTDEVRFLSMVRILRDVAQTLQLILLTCHRARFDRLMPDYRVDLDELKQRAG
jgi:DNA repair exonuclease SbcCD ATPase subunit